MIIDIDNIQLEATHIYSRPNLNGLYIYVNKIPKDLSHYKVDQGLLFVKTDGIILKTDREEVIPVNHISVIKECKDWYYNTCTLVCVGIRDNSPEINDKINNVGGLHYIHGIYVFTKVPKIYL